MMTGCCTLDECPPETQVLGSPVDCGAVGSIERTFRTWGLVVHYNP